MSKTLNSICFICVILLGCGQKSQRSTLLYVANVSGKAQTFNAAEFEWGLPDHRVIQFSACLKDQSREGAIQNQEIEILRMDQSIVVQATAPKTDRDGCVSWTEDFAVQSLQQPNYQQITRILKPRTTFAPVELHLAVNPWEGVNGSEAAVINSDQFEQAHFQKKSSGEIHFAVDHVSFQIDFDYSTTEPQGLKGQLLISFSPTIQLVGMTGREKALNLTKGNLDLKAQIWRQSENKPLELIAETQNSSQAIRFTNQNFNSGKLALNFRSNNLDVPGTYFLSLFANPIDAPKELAPLQRTYRIGSDLGQAGVATFDSKLVLPHQVQTVDPIQSVPSYRLDMIAGAFEEISRETEETQNEQTSRIRFMVPIINPLLKTPVVNREFKIKSLQGEAEIFCEDHKFCKTDEDGILRWVDQLTFSAFEKIKSRGHTYKIRLVDVKSGEEITQNIEINPQTSNSAAKIVDPREANNRKDSEVTTEQPVFKIQKICLSKVLSREIAEVDNRMQLNLRNKFDVVFKPRFLRFDDPAFGRQAPYTLPRVGTYLLTLVVYPTATKNKIVPISSNQTLFHYTGGPVVNLPFELLVTNPHDELRNAFAVAQLSFVDEKTNAVRHTAFKTPVMGFDFTLNDPGACQQFVSQTNFVDEQKSLFLENFENKDLNDVHQRYQTQLKTVADNFDRLASDRINNEWKEDAAGFHLKAVIADDGALKSEGLVDVSQSQFESALSCLEKASWAQKKQTVSCFAHWTPIYKSLCTQFFNQIEHIKTYKSRESAEGKFDVEIYSAQQRYSKLIEECANRPDLYFASYKQTYVYKHTGSQSIDSTSSVIPVTRNYNIGVFGGSDFMRESNFNLGAKAILLFPIKEIRKSLKLTRAERITAYAIPKTMTKEQAVLDMIIAFEEEGLATPKLPIVARNFDRFEQIYEFETLNNESSLTTNASFNVDTFNLKVNVNSSRDCYQLHARPEYFTDGLLLDDLDEILKNQARYYCFPLNSDNREISQSFRVFHYASTQPLQANINNLEATQSVVLKGYSDYSAFLSVFQDHMSPYHLDYIPSPLYSFISDVKKDERNSQMLALAETAGVLKSEPPVEPNTFTMIKDDRPWNERIMDWIFVRGDVKRERVKDNNRRHLAP